LVLHAEERARRFMGDVDRLRLEAGRIERHEHGRLQRAAGTGRVQMLRANDYAGASAAECEALEQHKRPKPHRVTFYQIRSQSRIPCPIAVLCGFGLVLRGLLILGSPLASRDACRRRRGALRCRAMAPFAVCSMCRKPIQLGSKYWRCSVSTCNSGRIKLM